ncbi:MAG: PspC domain-containing protein [Bacteroidales bacterium]|nr:PspC domain-containing protein [Bacteroidales bacterium]
MTQERSLKRSLNNRVIAGVCSGIADYFRMDPVIVRLIFVLLIIFGGGGLLVYIILWIVLPDDLPYVYNFNKAADQNNPHPEASENQQESNATGTINVQAENNVFIKKKKNGQLLTGLILIGLGLIFLLAALLPNFNYADFWPLLIIILGIVILKPVFNT